MRIDMRARARFVCLLLVAAAAACGETHRADDQEEQEEEALGYDAEHDCREAIACAREQSPEIEPMPTLEVCTEESTRQYEAASATRRAEMDELFSACREESGCEFVSCIAEASRAMRAESAKATDTSP